MRHLPPKLCGFIATDLSLTSGEPVDSGVIRLGKAFLPSARRPNAWTQGRSSIQSLCIA